MPRILTALTLAIALIVTAALASGAVLEVSLWNAIYAFALALVICDWWRWRSSDATPREVADQFMAHLVIFAIGVAMPAMQAVEARLGW